MLDDPYASHLPVLESLTPKPKRVLEFGAGLYSTAAFLAMDSVTRLVSIETDAAWRAKVAEAFADERWTLLDGSEMRDPADFDLVFIDDGIDWHQRIATIVRVLSHPHPRVVIHDAEYRPYREAIEELTSDFVIHDGYTPHTAVIESNQRKRVT